MLETANFIIGAVASIGLVLLLALRELSVARGRAVAGWFQALTGVCALVFVVTLVIRITQFFGS